MHRFSVELPLTTGTGGTIAGTGQYLKTHVPGIQVVLSDPEGSGLFNKVRYGVMFDPKESEGKKRRYVAREVLGLYQASSRHGGRGDRYQPGMFRMTCILAAG